MSWYLIVLLVIFYIAMWSITAIVVTRYVKSSEPEWIVLGLIWPIVLIFVPFVIVEKIVDKYGYKEEDE